MIEEAFKNKNLKLSEREYLNLPVPIYSTLCPVGTLLEQSGCKYQKTIKDILTKDSSYRVAIISETRGSGVDILCIFYPKPQT